MALSNYTELKASIATELDRSTSTAFTTAVPDLIKRCEAKMNRRLRLRNMELQATATYSANSTTRRISMPDVGVMLEMLDLWVKKSTAADSEYYALRQIPPFKMPKYYDCSDLAVYAWRYDIEFNTAPSVDYTVKMHYVQALDIATDSTNWVLTNFPDAYLYGSLAEAELFIMNDKRVPIWKSLFEEAMEEMNMLDDRSRNDAELDNRVAVAMASRRSGYRILQDN